LWSDRLNLIGKADLVEFHPDGSVCPVEFKHGAKRPGFLNSVFPAHGGMNRRDISGKVRRLSVPSLPALGNRLKVDIFCLRDERYLESQFLEDGIHERNPFHR
jgi:hypothetical protein